MDVTSLLNESTAGTVDSERAMGCIDAASKSSPVIGFDTGPSAIDASPAPEMNSSGRASETRAPGRSRRPWDAGGYSLPLKVNTKFIRTSPAARPMFYSESPTDNGDPSSPRSPLPRHKFSDSRSSLSSYTTSSSANSISHSRISSLSTVSEYQTHCTLARVSSSLDVGASDFTNPTVSCSLRGESQDRRSPTPIQQRHALPPGRSFERNTESFNRVRSPSDAVLIGRERQGTEFSCARSGDPSLHLHNSSHIISIPRPDVSPTRGHKRAVSAPDFPSIGAHSFNRRFPTFKPILELSHPSPEASPCPEMDPLSPSSASGPAGSPAGSEHSTEATPSKSGSPENTGSVSGATPGTTASPTSVVPTFDAAPSCMYKDNCDTGSQLRKAISHIFGRNKSCTRQIPAGVWVHYCRKHYQRSRYRNGPEYSKLQVGLVKTQVERVQAWSDANAQQGKLPVVTSWSLASRKREKNRQIAIKAAKNANNKRPFQEDSGDEDNDGADVDAAELNGTAVPKWLADKVRDGYSTAEIFRIIEAIKIEIDAGRLVQIPDVEFLPNILEDDAEKKQKGKRPYMRRKSGSHRRSQSDVHINKRQRADADQDDDDDGAHAVLSPPPRLRIPGMDLPHRPASTEARENTPGHGYYPQPRPYEGNNGAGAYGFDSTNGHGYGYGFPAGPLPPPNAAGQSSARRSGAHQRSQSEFSAFTQGPPAQYRDTPPYGYGGSGSEVPFDYNAANNRADEYVLTAQGPRPMPRQGWDRYERPTDMYGGQVYNNPAHGYWEAPPPNRPYGPGPSAIHDVEDRRFSDLAGRHSRRQSSPAVTRGLTGSTPFAGPVGPATPPYERPVGSYADDARGSYTRAGTYEPSQFARGPSGYSNGHAYHRSVPHEARQYHGPSSYPQPSMSLYASRNERGSAANGDGSRVRTTSAQRKLGTPPVGRGRVAATSREQSDGIQQNAPSGAATTRMGQPPSV